MKPIRYTLRAIGTLLDYPQGDRKGMADAVRQALDDERALSSATRERLADFAAGLERGDAFELAETWVSTFDRGRMTSLHLFEHVHGESRDRGQAMVDLKLLYERAGLFLSEDELPDYLPAFLEYLSTQDPKAAVADLRDTAEVLRKLGNGLARIGSRYAMLPAALLELAGAAGLELPLPEVEKLAPIDTEALDREWADEPVMFGGETGACGTAAGQPGQPAPITIHRKGAAAAAAASQTPARTSTGAQS